MNFNRYFDPFSFYFFSPDDDGGGGGGKEEKDSDTTDESDNNTEEKNDDKEVTFTDAQQKLINKKIGDARTKEREKLQNDKNAEELKSQGKFEKLYNDEKTSRESIEAERDSLKSEVETYRTRSNRDIETTIKEWDKDLKSSDPGSENVEARIKWFDSNKAIAAKLAGTGKAAGNGKAPNTDPGNTSGEKPDAKKLVGEFTKNKYFIPGQKAE